MNTGMKYQEIGEQMSIFTASDALQFAIRMSEDGVLFYREAAARSDKREVKKLFNLLSLEEAEYKRTFEKFLSKVTLAEPPEDYPGEYLAYLHNYIDGKIFVALDNKSSLSESSDVETALNSAIQRKMECIHYYQELKAFVPIDDRTTIDKIIAEKRKHIVEMSEEIKNS